MFLNSRMAESKGGTSEVVVGEINLAVDRLSPEAVVPDGIPPTLSWCSLPPRLNHKDQSNKLNDDQPRTSCPPNQTAAWAVPETGEGVAYTWLGPVSAILPVLTCRGPPLLASLCVLALLFTLVQWFSNFLHPVPPQKIFDSPSTTIMTDVKIQ